MCTKHNDIKPLDTQHNNKKCDTKHSDIKPDDIQHNNKNVTLSVNDTQHNDIMPDDTKHNNNVTHPDDTRCRKALCRVSSSQMSFC
jgi:hypothetical protein